MRIGTIALVVAVILSLGDFSPACGQSVGRIAGQVRDVESDWPLSGIQVTVLGTRHATVTDDDGRYAVPGLPPGRYQVQFSWWGIADHLAEVTVPAGESATLDARLAPAPIRLGEMVVTTASRQPERVMESPAAVSVVEPTRVRDLVVTDQVPLFAADLPGVYAMQSGLNSFSLNTRGFNGLQNRRMMILVDGRDITAPVLTTPEWPSISIVEDGASVELVRGPGSALYGANAFSGVLNIITPSIRQATGTRITLGGGELSAFRLEGRHSWVAEDLRWGFRVQGDYNRSETWDRSRTNLGDLEREYADAVGGSKEVAAPAPGFELIPLPGQTKATGPGEPGPVTGEANPLTTVRGSARLDYYPIDGSVVSAEGGFTRIQDLVDASSVGRGLTTRSDVPWARLGWAADAFNLMAYFTGRSGQATLLNSGAIFKDESSRIHLEGQVNRDLAEGRGNLVLGASFRTERVDTKGGLLAAEHDGRRDEYYAVFGQVRFEVAPEVKVILAGRLDEASLFDLQFAPKLGIVWTPDQDHALRVTLAEAYLMPSPTQRFLRVPAGSPLDLSAFETGLRALPLGDALAEVPDGELLSNSAAVPLWALGNETLDAEAVRSVELGYKGQADRVFFTADLHFSRFWDFATDLLPGVNPAFGPWTAPAAVPEAARATVEEAVNGSLSGITRFPDGTTAFVFSRGTFGEADQWGIDLQARFRVSDEVEFLSNYSYVTVDFKEGSFLGGDSIPTNTPTHAGHLAASYRSASGVRARLGLTLVDGFPFMWGTWVGNVPGRQTVDLSLGYDLSRRLRVNLSATNLLEQRRFHHFGGSVIGRRVLASLTWEG